MTFTTTPPTAPGFYAWRLNADTEPAAAFIYEQNGALLADITTKLNDLPVEERKGEWCRLVPAEEVEKNNNAYLVDIGRLQYLERIAETADALEAWLNSNTGTNADWPIEIKADEDGARKLSALFSELVDALSFYRNNK